MKPSRIRERFKNFARLFKDNWLLFKESTIGVIGLGIIIFFVVIALLAPILDIRDPINFRAPEEDVIDKLKFWENDLKLAWGPLGGNTSIAYRLSGIPTPSTDRIYVAASDKLFALDPDGKEEWSNPITTMGDISTPIVTVNYGENHGIQEEDYSVYLGTNQGYFYAITDNEIISQRIYLLDGPITSIAIYNNEKNKDRDFDIKIDVDQYTSPKSLNVSSPNVIKLSDNTYRMYYSDNNETCFRILSANSTDGFTWMEKTVRLRNTTGMSDSIGVYDPEVIKLPNNTYRMYYTGFDGTKYTILSAFSFDSLNWVKEAGIRVNVGVASHNVSSPDIIELGGALVMYYHDFNGTTYRILSANSSDGLTWTDNQVKLEPGTTHDAAGLFSPAVLKIADDNYFMYYTGYDGTSYRILSASSSNGIDWVKDPGVRMEPVGSFQTKGVKTPEAIRLTENLFRMYYGALVPNPEPSKGNVSRILSAISFDGSNFIREVIDKIYVGTAKGTLYVFDADYNELLNKSFDGEIHMTSYPFEGSYPLYSPCFTPDGKTLILGTSNSTLYSISTWNYDVLWNWTYNSTLGWSSSPIIKIEGSNKVAYMGTDDGWLYAFYINNGTEIVQWKENDYVLQNRPQGSPPKVGVPIFSRGQIDGGVLTTPAIYYGTEGGTFIFVGSDSGALYKIGRDQLGTPDADIFSSPGYTKAVFREEPSQNINYRFDIQPVFYPWVSEPKYLFAIENHDNGTVQPEDDMGIVYAFDKSLNVSWRISEENQRKFSNIKNIPMTWTGTDTLWFVTSDAIVFSYRASGEYLAPLPPTWIAPLESGNTYWLGTDLIGHDVFSQIMFGARTALLVGFMAAFFSILIGVIIGVVSGYFGGKIDAVLMRFTDVIIVIPFLPFVIVLAAVLGPSIWNIIIVIAILGWGGTARVIRSEVLSLKERPFIESAKVTGASNTRIMFKHIAPNVLPLAFLYMTFGVSGAILTEAALSFIGLGDFTQPSWGIMLFYINQSNMLSYWWLLYPPGLCIAFLSMGFYLVGRAFEQIVNPRLRRRR